jgi:D-inositol-3-phosphate glycosyltransferase
MRASLPATTITELQPEPSSQTSDASSSDRSIDVALLTGGFDKPYALGLVAALASNAITLEVIGSDELNCLRDDENLDITFYNLHGDQRRVVGTAGKITRYLLLYGRIVRYARNAKPRIFHILWNNKLLFFDRTILTLFYKSLGKKLVFTAHNVNAARRDGNDSFLNRLTLKAQYRLVDHIFVHTEKMKQELLSDFGVKKSAVSVIPFGVNDSIPDTGLSPAEAKEMIGITASYKTILFFGGIRPYKGLEYLVAALQAVADEGNTEYRLIIAGEPKREATHYWEVIKGQITKGALREIVIPEIRYIADEETELYFKAADVLVLPYTVVFQSGVLFLAYNFGLPVIATDVGSLRDDIVEGTTGYLCQPCDSRSLASTLKMYFASDLYKHLEEHRAGIKDFAHERNSWSIVGDITRHVYSQLISK